MFHITFCGFSQVRVTEADNTTFTMWGGMQILLPTLAEKIRYIKGVIDQYGNLTDFNCRRTMVISFMGGGAAIEPTIAREIETMIELRGSGLLSGEELQRLWKEAVVRSDIDIIEKISIFGGFGEARPTRAQEIQDLARIAAKGMIAATELEEMTQMLKGKPSNVFQRNFLQEKLRSVFLPPPAQEVSSIQVPPLAKSYLTE